MDHYFWSDILKKTQQTVPDTEIFGGHISSAEICGVIVSSIDFGAIHTKNNGPF